MRKKIMVKFFLDTSDIPCLEHWQKTGMIQGVTTNPSNLSKVGGNPTTTIQAIIKLFQNKDVSVQVTETDPKKVYEQALEIHDLGPNVVVKIPCVTDYCTIIENLVSRNIKINVTLIFSPLQALVMANLGVTYVSPFIGRLEDDNQNGIDLIKKISHIFSTHTYKTEILAASLRTVNHIQDSILAGADVVTIPPLLCEEMMEHHLTKQGLAQFFVDWKKLNTEIFP